MNKDKVYRVEAVPEQCVCVGDLTRYLESEHLTISCAESATCGLIAKLLTDRSGSSAWYWGGVESYANEAKAKMLGVERSILDDPCVGPVSWQCAKQMAEGMRAVSNTDVSLSVTGIAGPTGEEPGKPVGTVYFGFSSSFRETETIRVQFDMMDRGDMRDAFASVCLSICLSYVRGEAIIDNACLTL